MEALPRLRFVRESGAAYEHIYCCQQASFHRKSLEILGLDSSRVIASEKYRFIQAAELLVPRFVDEAEPWIIPWLREQFLPLIHERSRNTFPKRFFITRRHASGRRISNSDELMEKLTPLGFVVIALEDYEWLDQLALFQGAEAIIGPHGAGFANLVFSSASAVVIELIAEAYSFTFYPEISRQLQLRHHLVYGTPTTPGHLHSSDLWVDGESVARLVESSLPV